MEAETIELKNTLPTKAKEYEFAIAALNDQYGHLELTDLTDVKTYEVIRAARIHVKNTRVGVSKFCKSERDVANAYIKANTTKEKEILALLEPLELKLIAEETKYENEVERLRNVQAELERQEFVRRVNELKSLGAIRDEDYVVLGELKENVEHIRLYDNEQFNAVVYRFADEANKIKSAKDEADRLAREENERIERVKEEQRLEAQRLENIREQQEAKQRAIDAENERIAKQQQEKEDALRIEQEKIDAEKRRVVEEERARIEKEKREKELEQARKDAAELALKQAEEKRKAEIEKEQKRVERLPDKKKLQDFAMGLAIDLPTLKSDEAKEILDASILKINEVRAYINERIKSL